MGVRGIRVQMGVSARVCVEARGQIGLSFIKNHPSYFLIQGLSLGPGVSPRGHPVSFSLALGLQMGTPFPDFLMWALRVTFKLVS